MAWGGDTAGRRTITGERLQAARLRLYTKQMGCCAVCKEMVRFGPKTFIRDHIAPLGEFGIDTESNTQGLCAECSGRKTKAESSRGRARARL